MFEAARLSNEHARPGLGGSENDTFSPSNHVPPEYNASFLVPANAQYSGSSPPPAVGRSSPHNANHKSGRKVRGQQDNTLSMDDYFKEGEAKSKELEGPSSSRASDHPVPPPPKAAGDT